MKKCTEQSITSFDTIRDCFKQGIPCNTKMFSNLKFKCQKSFLLWNITMLQKESTASVDPSAFKENSNCEYGNFFNNSSCSEWNKLLTGLLQMMVSTYETVFHALCNTLIHSSTSSKPPYKLKQFFQFSQKYFFVYISRNSPQLVGHVVWVRCETYLKIFNPEYTSHNIYGYHILTYASYQL